MVGWHHRFNEHELGQTPGDSEGHLEEEMATHSNILDWKNPMDRGAW